MRFAAALSVGLLAIAAFPGAAEEGARLEIEGGRWLVLSQAPSILGLEEVQQHLDSGLTTTFAFTVEGRGGVEGGARVEVRYHLWDEVYRVAAVEIAGRVRRWELGSREELEAWWRELSLEVLDLSAVPARLERVRLSLDVIPFSAQEEADTERWLSETLARAGEAPGPSAGPRGEEINTLGQVFNALLATSIRRRAVTSYRWNLALPPRRSSPGGEP